jgi:hypothetical protein
MPATTEFSPVSEATTGIEPVDHTDREASAETRRMQGKAGAASQPRPAPDTEGIASMPTHPTPDPVEVEDMRVANLDLTRLGHALLKLPLVAVQLGHSSLADTQRYLHPSTVEAQFMTDVMDLARGRLEVEPFCEKWYGGMDGALLLLQRMWERDVPTEARS